MSLLDDIKDTNRTKWGSIIAPHHAAKMRALAPTARQFIFDEEASAKVGTFIRDCPDLMMKHIEFARLPYDPVYIEIDADALLKAIGRPTTADLPKYKDTAADWRVGYLSNKSFTFELVNSRQKTSAQAHPFGCVDLQLAKELGEKMPPFREPYDGKDTSVERMLGSTYDDVTPAQREEFRRRFGIAYYGITGLEMTMMKHIDAAFNGSCRNYVAAMLLLYNQKTITIADKPWERRMYKGKSRTFMAHHHVSIDLGQTDIRRAFQGGHHESPRRHEVRTHYAHRYGTRACEHNWVRLEDTDNEQWRCTRCDRLRWLKRQHLRGDAAKGFITKDYQVTARGTA